MKKTMIRLLAISCLLAAGSLNSVAQEKKPRPVEVQIQVDETIKQEVEIRIDEVFKVLAPKIAIGKVVKGAPYSASAITEHVQTLSDGNQIIRKNESKLYRDSEGRARTEQTLRTIGKWTSGGEAQQHIIITDPVAGVSYSLNPRTHTANRIFFQQKGLPADALKKLSADAQQSKTLTINGQTVTQAEFEAMAEKKRMAKEDLLKKPGKRPQYDPEAEKQLDMFQYGIPRIEASQGQEKEESLGTQTIEGVTAEGTRVTFTVPAGEIGNTLPMELVRETWYSPELQLVVMSKHRDPRSGETTYRLTNLTRSEPDHSLFGVPADYNVSEGKKPLPIKPKPMKEEE
ncbi:MAG TPA: hypothetical protein VJZ77_24470 [Blastocatellia bacterium]|nr:hypothetical protein [Blastocatellia bacterium]